MSTKGLRPTRTRDRQRGVQPLDRAAPLMMALLSVVIGLMLLLGSQALPSVRTFSWQGKAVSANDVAFLLTFAQPMDPQSVEQNLSIDPPLEGKFSWAGRKMAYTLAMPAPYGQSYKLSLPEAKALSRSGKESSDAGFEPFASEFKTRDLLFAYIGAAGEERGRLVLFNLTAKESTILTPEDQTVLDFKPYPERDRILYSAIDNGTDSNAESSLALPELFTVTTGVNDGEVPPRWQFWQQRDDQPSGMIETLLDNREYQNLKFDLSPDGDVIVVQRVHQDRPADFGPWVLMNDEPARKLKTEPGGDFKIAPDSLSLLLQQGKGTAVIALEPDLTAAEDSELLDFLPEYGLTLDIANDGSAAALVNFNQDDPEKRFTQSLFWVSNKGEEKPLLQTDGAILSAQFNESNEILYCLVNKLLPGEDYQVIPYLTAVNVKTGDSQKLLEMPPQPEITVSPAPDDLSILFDEALVNEPQPSSKETDFDGPTHRLWLLPLFSTQAERLKGDPVPLAPTELDIAGSHPVWLP